MPCPLAVPCLPGGSRTAPYITVCLPLSAPCQGARRRRRSANGTGGDTVEDHRRRAIMDFNVVWILKQGVG